MRPSWLAQAPGLEVRTFGTPSDRTQTVTKRPTPPSISLGGRPLREFNGDIPGPHEKHESTVVEFHDGIASAHARRREPVECGIEIVHREANVIEPQSGKVRLVRIGEQRRVVEPEKLHLLVGRNTRQREGDMVRFPVRNAHVARHLIPGDDRRRCLLKTEQTKEPLGLIEVSHGDGDMIESAVSRWAHNLQRRAFSDGQMRPDVPMGRIRPCALRELAGS
jgi:hypothetical protein